jgi:hypothetical protein
VLIIWSNIMALTPEEWSVLIDAGTLLAGIGGALWALIQYQSANKTRREDLRWRQAERADDLLDQILSNPNVVNAFRLLDWNGAKRFPYTNGDESKPIEVTWAEQDEDLKNSSGTFREMFVRESFDALYESLERVEHAITIGVVAFEDVAQPFRYYVTKIGQRKEAFTAFQKRWGYDMAKRFIERYSPSNG